MINDIYNQKKRHDEKSLEAKQARETMEQYMYTYLNQRYGLKQLIIEWAGAIIAGIKKYSKEDADVCLFGKVLRNEVDEEFRYVQTALKETVHALLKQMVREKHTLKGEAELKTILEDITNDKTQIDSNCWLRIIERMYDASDVELLEAKIRECASNRSRLMV